MNREIGIIIAFDESTSDEEKIKNSIESAIAQGKESMEIILAADSANDSIKELLTRYAESNDRIKVLYTSERRGRGGAFNLGLRNCTSEWVCFMNAGDTISPLFAEKLLKDAADAKADVVACANDSDSNDTDAAIFREAESLEEDEKQAILIVSPGRMESKIYKRTIFEENGLWFPENLLFEKIGIGRLALACAKNFIYVDECLYFFDKTRENTSEEDLFERLDVMTYFIEECYKREILEEFPEEVEAAFIDDMYMKTLFTYIAVTPANKRKKTFLEMLQNAILDCFPEFETNPYYYEKYDDDIKDLVSLHIEAPGKFLKTVKNFDSVEFE
ncbi:MAG: glycosyltransferase family 2 protein [Lachnospiraceae bacterium]|nr:glycosyltransferase family 2 protein [Lachnospiraceae bacterium]MBR5917030.1 glycosyltransferase family 2 protein [Lachnospiraceae bacterium]